MADDDGGSDNSGCLRAIGSLFDPIDLATNAVKFGYDNRNNSGLWNGLANVVVGIGLILGAFYVAASFISDFLLSAHISLHNAFGMYASSVITILIIFLILKVINPKLVIGRKIVTIVIFSIIILILGLLIWVVRHSVNPSRAVDTNSTTDKSPLSIVPYTDQPLDQPLDTPSYPVFNPETDPATDQSSYQSEDTPSDPTSSPAPDPYSFIHSAR